MIISSQKINVDMNKTVFSYKQYIIETIHVCFMRYLIIQIFSEQSALAQLTLTRESLCIIGLVTI